MGKLEGQQIAATCPKGKVLWGRSWALPWLSRACNTPRGISRPRVARAMWLISSFSSKLALQHRASQYPNWLGKIGTLSGRAGGICHVCVAAGTGLPHRYVLAVYSGSAITQLGAGPFSLNRVIRKAQKCLVSSPKPPPACTRPAPGLLFTCAMTVRSPVLLGPSTCAVKTALPSRATGINSYCGAAASVSTFQTLQCGKGTKPSGMLRPWYRKNRPARPGLVGNYRALTSTPGLRESMSNSPALPFLIRPAR